MDLPPSRRKIDVDKNSSNQTEVKVVALCSVYLIASQSLSFFLVVFLVLLH